LREQEKDGVMLCKINDDESCSNLVLQRIMKEKKTSRSLIKSSSEAKLPIYSKLTLYRSFVELQIYTQQIRWCADNHLEIRQR